MTSTPAASPKGTAPKPSSASGTSPTSPKSPWASGLSGPSTSRPPTALSTPCPAWSAIPKLPAPRSAALRNELSPHHVLGARPQARRRGACLGLRVELMSCRARCDVAPHRRVEAVERHVSAASASAFSRGSRMPDRLGSAAGHAMAQIETAWARVSSSSSTRSFPERRQMRDTATPQ